MSKWGRISALAALFFVIPLLSSGATTVELSTLLKSLQSQVAVLRGQLVDVTAAEAHSCPTLSRALSRGSKGSDVASLQQFLISQNLLSTDSASGFYGALTEQAVQRWQFNNNIAYSGSPSSNGYGAVGPKTRAAMLACTNKAPAVSPVTVVAPTYSYNPGYAQSSNYSEGSYKLNYSQGSYYSQASYKPGYSEGSYYDESGYKASYSQAAYYSQASYYAQGSYRTPVTTIAANPAVQKPYMGFNTYYANRIGRFQVNQNTLAQIADDMKSTGMAAAGYRLLGFDIGWWYSTTNTPRDATTHAIIPSPLITDLTGLIAHIHADGLTVGTYTDPGIGDASGCGGYPGSGGYIDQDVRQFITWGFDFLKLDHCGGNPHAGAITDPSAASAHEYGLWSTAILSAASAAGKQLVFNIGDFDGVSNRSSDYAATLGNSWRTQTDIANPPSAPITWNFILRSFVGNDVPPAAGPGHWNDPDYLLIGGFGLSTTEEQSNFNMWSIQAAPLILGTYPADLAPTAPDGPRLRAMLLNPEVISIDQDALGRQGEKVREDTPGQVVYSKMLTGSGRRAVLLLNENDSAASSMTVHWGDLGLSSNSAGVRDLVSRADLGTFTNSYTVSNVPAHGSRLLLVQGSDGSAALGSWQSLSKKILGNPAVVKNGSVVTTAALGLDRYYWVRGLSGSSISNWARIKTVSCGTDVIFFADPALLAANNAISVFGTGYIDSPRAQGIDSIRAYQAYSYDNGATWSCYGDLGKPAVGLYGRLAAASPDGSTVDLIGRGGDNALWYKRYTAAGGWGTWTSAGACVLSGVSASTRPNGVVDVTVIGCDNKVWHGWYTIPGTINWEELPGASTFSGTPSSVWNSALGTYSVFATALFGHDVQSSTWNSTTGWSAWTSLGGCSKSGVATAGVAPTILVGTACNTPGTTSDSDPIGDTPIYLSN